METQDHVAVMVLAHVAARAPHALRLTAQLFGCAPCPKCDYRKEFCRCVPVTSGKP